MSCPLFRLVSQDTATMLSCWVDDRYDYCCTCTRRPVHIHGPSGLSIHTSGGNYVSLYIIQSCVRKTNAIFFYSQYSLEEPTYFLFLKKEADIVFNLCLNFQGNGMIEDGLSGQRQPSLTAGHSSRQVLGREFWSQTLLECSNLLTSPLPLVILYPSPSPSQIPHGELAPHGHSMVAWSLHAFLG